MQIKVPIEDAQTQTEKYVELATKQMNKEIDEKYSEEIGTCLHQFNWSYPFFYRIKLDTLEKVKEYKDSLDWPVLFCIYIIEDRYMNSINKCKRIIAACKNSSDGYITLDDSEMFIFQ